MLKIFDVLGILGESPWRSCIFCTYWLNHNCLVGEIIFQLHQFKVSDSTKSNNTTPTLSHVKMESNSTLNYAAVKTKFNNMVTRRVVKSESPDSHVLERNRSTFFRFDEVGFARSRFFRFGGVGIGVLIAFIEFNLP